MTEIPPVYLYNTLTRKKERFEPIKEKSVMFYSCGQTVYEVVHVGNAKTYVVWDVLVRFLRFIGYNVKHIQNFTDVGHLTDDADEGEDKIVKKARELKEHPMELVDRNIYLYHQVMDIINVNRPNLAPRATAHLTEMIDLVEKLIENKHGYEVEGSVYFDISSFPDYGKMAKLNLDNLKAGARIEVRKSKKNPGDFALWIKAPQEHIMKYSSPWGKGYPGWHLECSVMAMKYLGDTIDIHAGGIDHIPVHHTNEIAQSEGATGKKFVNYWVHSEFITVNGEKMSKSKGNFYTLQQLIDEVGPGAARMVLTQAHYRTQADFSLKQARSTLKRYRRLIRSYHLALQSLSNNPQEISEDLVNQHKLLGKFIKALADDLNTPVAFAQINTIVNQMDQKRKKGEFDQVALFIKLFETMMDVLGVPIINLNSEEINMVTSLLETRNQLRKEGNLTASDQIRSFLQHMGYIIQDVTDGPADWYKFN